MKNVILLVILLFFIGGAFATVPEVTQLNYNPSPAIPGSTITLLLQLENNENNTKEDVTVSIKNNYPFTLVEENTKNIGNMEKYGKTIVTFTAYIDPSAENQSYELTVVVKTKDNTSGKGTPFPVVVSGNDPIVKVVGLNNNILVPGDTQTLNFDLKNVGTSTAYDIIIELQEDRTVTATGVIVEREITPLGAATTYINSLSPGEEKQGQITVSVNRSAELKNYTLPVEVSYRDSSGTRSTDTSYVGFKVAGDVKLDATLKENAQSIIAGVTSEISIELFNKGVGGAEYTLVEISSDNAMVDKPRQFIGALEPNDVDSFKTKITFPVNTVTGEQNIILNLTYQDTDAKTKTVQLAVPVKVYSQADGAALAESSPLTGIITLIIIIIIIFVAWKGYKKIKK